MKQRSIITIALLTTLRLTLYPAVAQFPGQHPFPGVTYKQETHQDPPMRLFIAEVDLTSRKLKIRVSPGGPDPDGPGEWETTLMEPTKVAAREGFDLAINGDFFKALRVEDAEGRKSHYRADMWASVVGPAVTDGKVWSTSHDRTPCLMVRKNGRVSIDMLDKPSADAQEVIAGNVLLVEKGKPNTYVSDKSRHGRTVVGLNEQNTRLIILVVDGLKPGVSIGMTYEELANEMVNLDCYTALNLDGGGSSVMVMRDPADGTFQIINSPSDGRERAVANVLGINVENGQEK